MLDDKSISKIILKRTSTRAYSRRRLTQDEIHKISVYINSSEYQKGIFGYVRFELVENKNDSVFGAYGEITGVNYYIAVVAKNNKKSLLDVGYAFERLILYAESIGLGTCWLAATSFDRNAAELYTPLKGDEIIVTISPIGEKAQVRSDFDLGAREEYGSDSRLEFDTLFTDVKTGGRIVDEKMIEVLNLVRAAPSALNNQPWRVAIDGDIAHFYVIRRFVVHLNYDFQMMDMGAAVYHYSVVTGRRNFFIDNPNQYNGLEYVISVR